MTPSRNCIALLCLAMLFLALLTPAFWAIILPFCYLFSLAVTIAGVINTKRQAPRPGYRPLLPARAPPAIA
ncbi:MAG: hypothetical protein ABSF22_08715 [Bryobacteraceae bacterium]